MNEREQNRERQQQERSRYMSREITHQEYYLWLSEFIGIKCPAFLVEAAAKSKDEHLNDIPLSSWDSQHSWVAQRAATKGIPWSLSDTVCCLKALARQK